MALRFNWGGIGSWEKKLLEKTLEGPVATLAEGSVGRIRTPLTAASDSLAESGLLSSTLKKEVPHFFLRVHIVRVPVCLRG